MIPTLEMRYCHMTITWHVSSITWFIGLTTNRRGDQAISSHKELFRIFTNASRLVWVAITKNRNGTSVVTATNGDTQYEEVLPHFWGDVPIVCLFIGMSYLNLVPLRRMMWGRGKIVWIILMLNWNIKMEGRGDLCHVTYMGCHMTIGLLIWNCYLNMEAMNGNYIMSKWVDYILTTPTTTPI